MSVIELIVVIALWAICGFLAYGRTFADFQRTFLLIAQERRSQHKRYALTIALGGPIGLLASLIMGRHGFMWRAPK